MLLIDYGIGNIRSLEKAFQAVSLLRSSLVQVLPEGEQLRVLEAG